MFKNLKFNFDSETALKDLKDSLKKNYNKAVDFLDKNEIISPIVKIRENTKRRSYNTKNNNGYSINIEVPGYLKENIIIELDDIKNIVSVNGTNDSGTHKEKFEDSFFIDLNSYNIGIISLCDGILTIQIIDTSIKEEVKESVTKKFTIN